LQAAANPLDDEDNDSVPDDIDLCPTTFGVVSNFGCPASMEIVRVTESHSGYLLWVECPEAGAQPVTHWMDCPSYSTGWGDFSVGYYNIGGPLVRVEQLSDEDGDGIYDGRDECPGEAGPNYYDGCPASVYCAAYPSKYEQECFRWARENLSLYELGTYFEGFRDFVESGCDKDFYHWACFMHNRYIRPSDRWAGLVRWTNRWSRLYYPPNCPDNYHPVSNTSLFGGFEFPIYPGTCMSNCRAALVQAGLLSSALGAAGPVAVTKAGRVVLNNAGIIGSVGASSSAILDLCSGPTYVPGTYGD